MGIKSMKQYHFERSDFCQIFEDVFKGDLCDFIDGVFGVKKVDSTGFDYTTENFKCFRIEEDYYILSLDTGVLIGWYKGQHLGRINVCSRPDFTLEDLKEMLIQLRKELGENYD